MIESLQLSTFIKFRKYQSYTLSVYLFRHNVIIILNEGELLASHAKRGPKCMGLTSRTFPLLLYYSKPLFLSAIFLSSQGGTPLPGPGGSGGMGGVGGVTPPRIP